MKKNKYDVFISYRRDGGEQKARIIQQALIARGYDVFLDFDELRDGIFNEALNTAIAETPIFLLLLTRGCLNRCVNEGDWVRREIETALETDRHIIPVNPDSEFDGKFPEELPIELKKVIGQHQFSDIMFKSLFNESIDKMVRDRIRPILNSGDNKVDADEITPPSAQTSTIHLETDMACAVLRFKSLECVLQVGEDKVLHLTKGRHKFTFQSTDNANDKYDMVFDVKEEGIEDFIDINLVPFKKERLREEALDRKRRKPKGDWFLGEFYEFSYDEDYDKEVVETLIQKEDTLSAEEYFELGVHYFFGWGTSTEFIKAYNCFNKSAEKGYAKAVVAVGVCYANGTGVEQNPSEAFRYFCIAEEKSLPFVYYDLGLCYKDAIGVEKNDKKAFEYFQKADQQAVIQATYEIAECYLRGVGTQRNEKKAFDLYNLILSQQDHTQALIRKGDCYFNGWGTEENYEEGYKCFLKASEDNSPWALIRLAECYEKGFGTEKDGVKAILTYIKANHYGSPEASERLEKELTPNKIKKLINDVSVVANPLYEKYGKNDFSDLEEKKRCTKDLMIYYDFLANKTGDSDSQTKLAECYEQGIGIEIDYQKANELWLKLIEKGNVQANRELGINLIIGNGDENLDLGLRYLEHAVNEGDDKAMLLLGRVYNDDELGIASEEKALYYMKMSADKGNAEAQWRIAELYKKNEQYDLAFVWATKSAIQQNVQGRFDYGYFLFEGIGCEQDINLGLSIITTVANEGYDHAQWNLGEIYRTGHNVEENIAEAAKWYEMAAEQGHVDGMFQYAFIYFDGVGGVIENEKKALEYFRRAAESGDERAEYCIGCFYEDGRGGVEQDYQKAYEWYMKAAEQEHAGAQFKIGWFYENGQEVEQDYAKAYEWYIKAAEQGDADAQLKIGYLYDSGQGVEQDDKEAYEWYMKAAEQGNAVAQCTIGNMYENGQGVEQDLYEALNWYIKASENGLEMAINAVAWTYHLMGEYDKALPWAERILENDEKDPNELDTVATVYQGLGRYLEALEIFESCLEVYKDDSDDDGINETEEKIKVLKELMSK